jgi:hypothetical protein
MHKADARRQPRARKVSNHEAYARERHRFRLPVRVGVLAAALAGSATSPVFAHMAPSGWAYPYQCCSNRDCQPMHGAEITEGPGGYVIEGTGEVLSYTDPRLKESPDGEFHLCLRPGDHSNAVCLFVPPRSF